VRIEEFRIDEVSSEIIIQISCDIPEFYDPYGKEEYFIRLKNRDHLVLIAYEGGQPVGFKVGYNRNGDGSFYSWMGGVLPSSRKRNIARSLAIHQQKWVLMHGYHSIRMKTRNKCKAMLIFALSDGFQIIGFEEKTNADESRIILEKTL